MKAVIAILLLVAASPAVSQLYYEPDQPGHGVSVERVGERYVAQWYFHDSHHTRWVASDVCVYGGKCPIWTVEADGFPARNAGLIEVGYIRLEYDDDGLRLDYYLNIEEDGLNELGSLRLEPLAGGGELR